MLKTKNEKIIEVKSHIEGYTKSLESAGRVKEALEDYKLENINIKFFKKYFSKMLEFEEPKYNREILEFQLLEPKYEFQKSGFNSFNKRLYIGEGIELELQSTTKTEILAKLLERIEIISFWNEERKKTLAKIEAINEPEALEAIRQVFIKYNAWKLQDELLGEAKYLREPEEEREPLETVATSKK